MEAVMGRYSRIAAVVTVFSLLAVSLVAAQVGVPTCPELLPGQPLYSGAAPFPLADGNGMVSVPGLAPRDRTADLLHRIFGVAAVVAGGLTGILNPEVASYDVHHTLGWTSAALSGVTLATGFWAHHTDVGLSRGMSPANVHALLGIIGGVMMVAAPITASAGGGEEGGELHAALGAGGELLMGASVMWLILF